MEIELFILIRTVKTNSPTIEDLAVLTQEFSISSPHENIEFVIRVISKSENLLDHVNKKSIEPRNTPFIIISDQLVDNNTVGHKYAETDLLREIINRLRHTKSLFGLIGIFPDELPSFNCLDVISIDAYATFKHNSIQLLRDKLLKVARRIWLKSPVVYNNPRRLSTVNSIEITSIRNKEELYDCLRLRKQVYESLGYILMKKNHGLETDSYDPVSFHFRAIDSENGNKTVGTMRLIVPSLSPLNTYANLSLPNAHWFKGISEKARPFSLPVFRSFQYFRSPDTGIIPQDMSNCSRDVCEISRVIVSPEYRGMGISKLLMHHAIKVAQQLKRNRIWLECEPHHIEMYKKLGFTIKDHESGCFYERIQQFDAWAVAMYLTLEKTANSSLRTNESSATCYCLPITKGRAENCTLRFQYFDKPVDKIKNIFEQPLPNFGQNTPLKHLIPSSLTNLNVKQFITCLKQVFDDVEPNKLSFLHHSGRNHVFNTVDIKSGNRGEIETRLYQWLG